MAYLEKIDKFRGNGSRNAKGETLEDFLAVYNPKKYDCPSNTVDMIILRSEEPWRKAEQPLKLLMIRRKNHPSIGFWALPGGFVELREDLATAAARELEEETGVTGAPLIQLRTWGEPDRDPRWRVITTAYLALVEGEWKAEAGDDAADAAWFDVSLKEESADGNAAGTGGLKDGEEVSRLYRLELSHPGKALTLSALVRRTVRRRGILTDDKYELLENHDIAIDHAQMIVDALLVLRRAAAEAKVRE